MLNQVSAGPLPSDADVDVSRIRPDHYRVVEGCVSVYGDGSAIFNLQPDWCRGSWSIVYGEDSPLNCSAPLQGHIQTIYRAELQKLEIGFRRAWRPTCFSVDNKRMADRANVLLDNPSIAVDQWESADLWKAIKIQILHKQLLHCGTFFIVSWIKAHASDREIAQGLVQGEDVLWNEYADALAKQAIWYPA